MKLTQGDFITYEIPRYGQYGYATVYEFLEMQGDEHARVRPYGTHETLVIWIGDPLNKLRTVTPEELGKAVADKLLGKKPEHKGGYFYRLTYGNGTYHVPKDAISITVQMVGGGGGSGHQESSGDDSATQAVQVVQVKNGQKTG